MNDKIVFIGKEFLKGKPACCVEEKRNNFIALPDQWPEVESRENQ